MGEPKEGMTRRKFLAAGAMAGVAAGAGAMPAMGAAGMASGEEAIAAQTPAQVAGPPANVDLLIVGPDIVTFDDRDTVIADGAMAVRGNAIVWMGKAAEAKGRYVGRETINAAGLIAMPGLTDTHYHTAQQFLRGVHRTSRRKGPSWKKTLIPFESGLTPEDVYASGLVGYTSMISAGTTCFLEAGGPHPDMMGKAAEEVGIRGRIALNTCDQDGPGGPLMKSHLMTTSQALRENEALVKRWKGHPRVEAWLSLRQILVNTEECRKGMMALAEELDTVIHTHVSEGTYEVDYTVEEYGMRPPAYLDSIGVFNKRVHAAHSVLLTTPEVELYAKRDVSVAHCAFHNYNLAPHRMYDMVEKGIRCGLGTDGPGSRGTLDMFQVCHYAVLGQTIEYGMPYHSPGLLTYVDMLKLACRNGARAAGLGDKTGSLEAGKLADVVLVGHDDYDQFGSMDPTLTLAQNVIGHHVRTVVVDGRVVMKDREFLTVDLGPVRARMRTELPKIIERYEKAIA